MRLNHGGSGGSGGGSNASSVGNYHHSGQMGQMGVYSSTGSTMANNFNQQRYNFLILSFDFTLIISYSPIIVHVTE